MIMHADDAHDEAMQAGELTANLSCICPQLYPPMMPPAIIPSPVCDSRQLPHFRHDQ